MEPTDEKKINRVFISPPAIRRIRDRKVSRSDAPLPSPEVFLPEEIKSLSSSSTSSRQSPPSTAVPDLVSSESRRNSLPLQPKRWSSPKEKAREATASPIRGRTYLASARNRSESPGPDQTPVQMRSSKVVQSVTSSSDIFLTRADRDYTPTCQGWLKIDDHSIRWCEMALARIYVYRKPQQVLPEQVIFLKYRIVDIVPSLKNSSTDTVAWRIYDQHEHPNRSSRINSTIMEAPEAETATLWLRGIRDEMRQALEKDLASGKLRRRGPTSPDLNESLSNDLFIQKLRVWVGTWNMGEAFPPKSGLEQWIKPENNHDIYVFGLQECPTSTASMDAEATIADDFLIVVAKGGDYRLLSDKTLWGIRIIVFVKYSLMAIVSSPKTAVVRTGVGSVMGNKGGVAVSFFIHETGFCFIACHLAAHMDKVMERNRDFRKIMKGVGKQLNMSASSRFRPDDSPNASPSLPAALSAAEPDMNPNLTSKFRYVFFLGDLNYRIEADRDWVISKMESGDFDSLTAADQLKKAIKEGAALTSFHESRTDFAPTYRYKRNEYDQKKDQRVVSNDKLRVPSWCDRIFLSSWPGSAPTFISYDACHKITTSDHSPVLSQFELDTFVSPNVLHALSSVQPHLVKWKVQIYELKVELGNLYDAKRLLGTISVPSFASSTSNVVYFDMVSCASTVPRTAAFDLHDVERASLEFECPSEVYLAQQCIVVTLISVEDSNAAMTQSIQGQILWPARPDYVPESLTVPITRHGQSIGKARVYLRTFRLE